MAICLRKQSKLGVVFAVVVLVSTVTAALALSTTPSDLQRQRLLQYAVATTTAATLYPLPSVAAEAKNAKSRSSGYSIQKTKEEWANQLSPLQYNILRRGGTERQKSSILNTYTSDQEGTYACAGCGTALFSSADKFASNTGWPSFASALEGVERIQGDDEVRCATCGGHLGDLFQDGWRYPGTPASKTGKRYCIDGTALVFQPSDGGPSVRGDQPPPAKVIQYEQPMYRSS